MIDLATGRMRSIWEYMDSESASELRRDLGDSFDTIDVLARECFLPAVTVVHFVSPAWCEAMLGTSDRAEARTRCATATNYLTDREGDALALFVELAPTEAEARTVESLGSSYRPLSRLIHGDAFVERIEGLLRDSLTHAFATTR